MSKFICHQCKAEKEKGTTESVDSGAGYGIDKDGKKICYACCAVNDKKSMRETGKVKLYLENKASIFAVTNWPGTLRIVCNGHRIGGHNMAGKRYDVWFTFEGTKWHGVTYGIMTQICHCKRLKVSPKSDRWKFAGRLKNNHTRGRSWGRVESPGRPQN